ncbi:MAG TPA: hypothetical protein VF294_16290 [Polyangiaceae bacterium]
MTRKPRLSLSYAPFALAIWACNVASAANGERRGTPGVRPTTTATAPSSPADEADPPPAPHKPPHAAFDACKSLSEGDTCSVSFNGHTMNGTCRKGPNGEAELACVPSHPPGPPPSDPPSGSDARSSAISSSALERQQGRLEREINGS